MLIKVEIDGQVYEVKILEIQGDEVLTEVAGKTYGVNFGSQTVQTQSTLPTPAKTSAEPETAAAAVPEAKTIPEGEGALTLKSPLPGTIVEIKVKAGQTVKSGEVLMVLEAMKMKNSIRSLRDGIWQKFTSTQKIRLSTTNPCCAMGSKE